VLEKGLFLMVIGMGVTFLFLGILIISMMGASKLIWKFFPEPEEPVTPSRVSTADTEIAIAVAAVTARLHK
jgi:sodium pump decarboxylase gamma subunit